jgi:hypothetical protein
VARGSLRSPRAVLLVWALVLAGSLPGLERLHVDTSTDSVLDRGDPAWSFYQHSQDLFGGDETLVVALEGERPFAAEVIREVARLTRRLESLPAVRRVDSIATVPVVRVAADGTVELDPALAGAPEDPAALGRHVAGRLDGDRIAPRTLISEDGRVFAANVLLRKGSEGQHESLLASVYDLVRRSPASVSGVPVFRVETNGRTRSEILFFGPLTALLLAGFVAYTFRSGRAVLLCLLPGALGSLLMLAAMGAFGAPLAVTTMILPSIVLALGSTYTMHLLDAGSGRRGPEELEPALRDVALPVTLSGLTTGVGLLGSVFVRIEAVRSVGVFGSIGVLAVTVAALTLVPAGLRLLPLPKREPRGSAWIRRRLAPRLVAWAGGSAPVLVLGWCLVLAGAVAGALRLEVDTDATQWLPRGNPVRDAYEAIRARLSGISPVNVVVEVEEGRSVLEPEILSAVDGLSGYLESLPEVGKAVSVADPLRQLHGGFAGDAAQPLPRDRDLAEQYLLLLESVEQVRDLVTQDRRAANILLRVDHNGSSHLLRVADAARDWWRERDVEGARIQPTGIMYEYARAEDEIALGQLRGLGSTLLVIAAVLYATFRSVRVTLVSLVPDVIPLTMIFGLMGFVGAPLDAGTVLVGSLAVGIAVDDTIHLTSGFLERVESRPARAALASALESVLTPVVFTTVMISVGFAVLALSEFTFTRNLGLLTAFIMVVCLVSDATLLPALLLAGRRRRGPEARLRPAEPELGEARAVR